MTDIDELRNKIDDITLQMVKLLKTRNELAKEIGTIKKDRGLSVTDETRENNLRDKVVSLCKETGLDEAVGTRFLNFLLNESVKVQTENKLTHLSIFLKAKSLEEQGKKIIHMEVGEPDFFPPSIVKTALEEVYDRGFTRYGNSKGMTLFREALAKKIAQQYKTDSKPDNILVCPGSRYAVYLAITTMVNVGDEIIVFEPAWPAYKDCASINGIKVRSVKTTFENKWQPTIDQITEAINKNTKMIVLNYPNNPTGKILASEILDDIMEIAKKNNLYVLSDEVYSQYTYEDWKSVLSYKYDKAIVTKSFSKSHSMTGFRIGYAIAAPEIIDNMAKLQAICLTNVSEPIQYVAMRALEADTSGNPKNIKSKLDIVIKKAKEIGLRFVNPDGAMYVFATADVPNFDGTAFVNNLLERGVAVAPGEGFGDYKNFVRISVCQDENKLIEGMDIINDVLRGRK